MAKHDIPVGPGATDGFYGSFGGSFYPERASAALTELADAYGRLRTSTPFLEQLSRVRATFQGRPTPIHHLRRLSAATGGAQIYVKREDLNHTGAHKINHCVGFALLAREMGKSRLIAETGAGQHGVGLAAAAAYFGLECEIHIGDTDNVKVALNVSQMELLGARVVSTGAGQSALKEASDAAFTSYLRNHETALYAIGSAIGPHPFPMIVRDFQSVIGTEARAQFTALTGGPPDHVVACVAGGSNALGIFSAFTADLDVRLHAVEPLGRSAAPGQHGATLTYGRPGRIHGSDTLVLQDGNDQPLPVSSIASGLVYPGVGPEMAMLVDTGRVGVSTVSDAEALEMFVRLARLEGIIAALESVHAVHHATRLAAELPSDQSVLVNLSGRGDKDAGAVLELVLPARDDESRG
ncbi:tryptophan synthase subunit beta [Serinicoccus kebangsaanensis]|uniref:tryptophan synthase subunit beta n=1 Tax=Serinicoccus kebangsaanensis TaxID=2602069 RepID=UPI00124C02D0|nr:tryptophan synthase subunit beta [Serinicoccus kebangsaanensis]